MLLSNVCRNGRVYPEELQDRTGAVSACPVYGAVTVTYWNCTGSVWRLSDVLCSKAGRLVQLTKEFLR